MALDTRALSEPLGEFALHRVCSSSLCGVGHHGDLPLTWNVGNLELVFIILMEVDLDFGLFMAVIIITGGSPVISVGGKVEILRSNGSYWCSLPELPDHSELEQTLCKTKCPKGSDSARVSRAIVGTTPNAQANPRILVF